MRILIRKRKQKSFAMTANGIKQGIYGNVIRTYKDNPDFKAFTDEVKNRTSIKGVKEILEGSIAFRSPIFSYCMFEDIAKLYEQGKTIEEVITYIDNKLVGII